MKYSLVLLLLFCSCAPALGQSAPSPEITDLAAATVGHQRTAMYVLGGYALLNLGGGLLGRAATTGATRRFHEMNALWNTVNLGIAAVGLYGALRADPAGWSLAEAVGEHHKFGKVLLFNAGLDVGYVAGGLYLLERARRPGADADQLRGYGRSVMFQGAFLFVFDLVNYALLARRGPTVDVLLGATEAGLGLTLRF